jgi:rod shape-determining protein MreC
LFVAVLSVNRRRVIVLLALTSIILLTLDLQGSSATSTVRTVFGVAFRPIESVTRVMTRPLSNSWYGITHYDDVKTQNQLLREKIAQQEGAAVAAAASVRLSQELLALNGLPTLAGINSVTAQVIGDSPSNYLQSIEINQGSESGINIGMPVLNAAGLVGRVTRVFADRAVVMLITDPEYALSVKVVSTPKSVTVTTIANEQSATTVTVEPIPDTTVATTVPAIIPGFTPGATTVPATPVGVTTLTIPISGTLAIRETGILEGQGSSRSPTVRFISTDQRFGAIEVGAPIVSAGGSMSLAPPDIVIGVVSRVVPRLGTAGPLLEIKLVADLSNLSFLRILLYQPITERVTP